MPVISKKSPDIFLNIEKKLQKFPAIKISTLLKPYVL